MKKEVIIPGFDGTGPEGKGPGTGRGKGQRNQKKSSQNQSNQKDDSWIDIILRIIRMIRKK